MKRRSKTWKGTLVSDKVFARFKPYAGQGFENVTIADRDFWNDEDDTPWISAFEAIDKRGDKKPLLKWLRSGFRMSPAVRQHFAKLLDRYDLEPVRRGRGRPPTPSYDRKPDKALRLLAMEEVRGRVAQAKSGVAKKGGRGRAVHDKAIEDTILSLAAINPKIKGFERDVALEKAADVHGISFKALKQDFNRGQRPTPKKKAAPK